MTDSTRTAVSRYAGALAATALAVLLRRLLDPWLGEHLSLVTLHGAVALAVWFGGSRPALAAAALGYLACDYLFIEPRGALGFDSPRNLIGLLTYLLSCGVIIGFGRAVRSARREADAGRALLEREVARHRSTEERFRLAAEAVSGIIYEYDFTTGQVERTRGLYEVVGYRPDEVPPTAAWWWQQVHPDDVPAMQKRFEEAAAAGAVVSTEYRVRHKDGRWLHVEDRAVLLKDGAGKPRKLVGCTADVTDRRRGEDALRARTAELESLLAGAPLGLAFFDREHRYTRVNAALAAVNGIAAADHVGRTLAELLPANARSVDPVIDRVFATGEAVGNFEVAGETPARPGERRHWLTGFFPVRGERGGVGEVGVWVVDITDRKRTEEELRRTTEQLRVVTDGMAAPVTRCSRDHKYLWVSKPYADWIGRPADEIVGRSIPDVIGPEAFEVLLPHFRDVLAGKPVRCETEVPFRSIGPRWVSVVYTPTAGADGVPDGWVAVVHDLTDRRRMEDELRRQAVIFENQTDAIIVTDLDGRIRDWNPACERMLGYTKAEVVGRTTAMFHRPEDAATLTRDALAATERDGVWRGEITFVRKDGALGVCETVVKPLTDRAGAVVGAIGVNRDVTDRKRAEEELRASEERLRHLAEAMPQIVWTAAPGGRITYINARWTEFTGLTLDQTNDPAAVTKVIHPDDAERVFRRWERALADGTRHEAEWRFRDQRDGSYRWFLTRAVPVRDGGGAVAEWFGTATDIDDQKRLEEVLRASEERHRRITDLIPFGAWATDAAGRPTYLSPLFLDMLGQTLEEHRAGWADTVHPDDALATVEKWRAFVAGESEWHHEFRVRGRDGEYRHVLARGFPVRDANGRATEFVGINYDITARKRQEEAVEAGRRTLHSLVELCPFGIYLVDAEFRIASVNAGSQAGAFANVRPLIGRPLDETMRILWGDTVGADVAAVFRRTLDTGEPYSSRDFVNPRSDTGVVESYEWELHRIALPDGRHGVVCYYFDATRLREAERRLREADRRKDEFLATLAHELRNPLAPVRNAVQIVRAKSPAVPELAWARDVIERQVGHMARLLDDLLDVSRITRNKLDLRRERVTLAAVVAAAVETSRPVIDSAGHELAVALPPEPVYLDADPVRLAQVFANLLNNAAKYTDRGGHVRLTAERDGGEVVVTVADDGIGLAADLLPRLFEIFTQAKPALERAQGGLGIGLSLVKGLVGLHGGTVEARSDGPGKGSEFVVRLPAAAPVAPVPPAVNGDGRPRGGGRRVVVADDNRDAAESLAMLLTIQGHEVRTAGDGQEAVEVSEDFRPDVVLLDIGMPRLNGYDAARCIRERAWGGGVLLVALTGWGQEDDRRRAADAGFDRHFTKPVDLAELEKLLAGARATTG